MFLLSGWKAVLEKGIREGGTGAFYMIPNLSCLWACVCLSALFKRVERVYRRKSICTRNTKKNPLVISSLVFSPPFVCEKKKKSHTAQSCQKQTRMNNRAKGNETSTREVYKSRGIDGVLIV